MTEDEIQLGLYFNRWPTTAYGVRPTNGEYTDILISRTQMTKHPKRGVSCSSVAKTEQHQRCIADYLKRSYLSYERCGRGMNQETIVESIILLTYFSLRCASGEIHSRRQLQLDASLQYI